MTSETIARLFDATQKGDFLTVMFLLSSRTVDINVNETNSRGDACLHISASHGNSMITLLLIQRGADVNIQNKIAKYTPLHRACWNGHVELASLLIEQGAQVDQCDGDGYSALHWSAWNGQLQTAYLLLRNDADVNLQDSYLFTPLHRACLDTGYAETIFLLLNFGADPDIQNEDGNTPLHLACKQNNIAIVKLLIQFGAKIGIQNNQNLYPSNLTTDSNILKAIEDSKSTENLTIQGRITSWGIEEVSIWLRKIGLGLYQNLFSENEIDGQGLLLLVEDDLNLLFSTQDHIEKFKDELSKFKSISA